MRSGIHQYPATRIDVVCGPSPLNCNHRFPERHRFQNCRASALSQRWHHKDINLVDHTSSIWSAHPAVQPDRFLKMMLSDDGSNLAFEFTATN